MITLPSVLIYKDIEVFPDHEDCNKYYFIRSVPHVGISHQTNLPIFHAEFWSAAKASDRETSLPQPPALCAPRFQSLPAFR